MLAGVAAFLAITFGAPLITQPQPAAVGSSPGSVPSATSFIMPEPIAVTGARKAAE
ncbi:hypothetical protein ACLH0K_17545 [Arthrobacter sp. MPF02]|uniref:hypothetical protein n=1 Tax=Arthrobacter sp. MPF02 TaxID=3388492 RepID=UPI0039848B4F